MNTATSVKAGGGRKFQRSSAGAARTASTCFGNCRPDRPQNTAMIDRPTTSTIIWMSQSSHRQEAADHITQTKAASVPTIMPAVRLMAPLREATR